MEALRQSEERYRTLFDQSPVGVYIFDKRLKITQCNERLVQILQSSYDKIIELDMRRLKDQGFVPAMEKSLEGQFSYHEGFYEATTSSARLWLSLRFSPLRDAHGNVIGGMGVVEDVSERKHLENQLYQAQKMEAIGQLAGGVAHDFNNLLTAVIGYSQFMLYHLEDLDQLKKDIDEIGKAGERAALLTNQLLTFSRRNESALHIGLCGRDNFPPRHIRDRRILPPKTLHAECSGTQGAGGIRYKQQDYQLSR